MQNKHIPRHALCPCGSGQKYKHCCGRIQRLAVDATDELLRQAREAAVQGNLVQAEQFFRQLLQYEPQQAEALAGVGQCLCWQHSCSEGLAFLRQAARVLQQQVSAPQHVRPLVDLGTQLMHWGDLKTALDLAQTAVQWAPDHPAALNNLALCYSRANRDQDALPYARHACRLLPDDPGCTILLAILEARQGELNAAQKHLEHVLAVCQDEEHVARAWLELAGVFDKLGHFERAFAALETASAKQLRLPALQAIDAEAIFTAIRDNRAGFTPALLQRWPAQVLTADALPQPVFLFGFLRSGTTLIEQVLAAHPQIITSNEEPFIAELISQLRRTQPVASSVAAAVARLTLEEVRHLRAFYWQRVSQKYGDLSGKCFIDKMALNTIEAGLIAVIFPEAKILFALRDPRDVCLSCYMQAFTPSAATVNLLSWQGIARQYAAVMDYWLAIRDYLAPEILELRYEASLHDFEATYRKVCAFLAIDWHPDCAHFYTHVAGRYIATPSYSAVGQPLYKTAAGRWRNYAQAFTAILPPLQRFIEAFAYDH
jgi:tetratricopeptide (TPR) repeat protein